MERFAVIQRDNAKDTLLSIAGIGHAAPPTDAPVSLG